MIGKRNKLLQFNKPTISIQKNHPLELQQIIMVLTLKKDWSQL